MTTMLPEPQLIPGPDGTHHNNYGSLWYGQQIAQAVANAAGMTL